MAHIAITGAGRGIGLELTRQHVAQGDRVYALVRNPAAAEKLQTLAAQSGGLLTVHQMDVANEASVRAGAASTGNDPIDIVYNVAGIVGNLSSEVEQMDWAAFDEVMDVVLKGPMHVFQAFLPRLAPGSKVITLTSQVAASTWPYGGYYAYVAAKAGLNRLMRSLAADVKERGITIGLIHPGYVQTDMGGPDAEITPEESAAGIRKVAAQWQLEQSGDFYKWNGEPHAW